MFYALSSSISKSFIVLTFFICLPYTLLIHRYHINTPIVKEGSTLVIYSISLGLSGVCEATCWSSRQVVVASGLPGKRNNCWGRRLLATMRNMKRKELNRERGKKNPVCVRTSKKRANVTFHLTSYPNRLDLLFFVRVVVVDFEKLEISNSGKCFPHILERWFGTNPSRQMAFHRDNLTGSLRGNLNCGKASWSLYL